MITPGEIGLALLMVALWIFDAFVWVTTYICYRDLDEWGDADIVNYAMVVIVGAASVALTVFLALLTLCAVGIVG